MYTIVVWNMIFSACTFTAWLGIATFLIIYILLIYGLYLGIKAVWTINKITIE